jgi:NAD(P)-dependent dehydrogenase (short-subunit alcohol dehydrogenase family)
MDLQLDGKTAIVTGGSRGIGLAVVHNLIDEGVRVVTGSRSVTTELAATEAIPVEVDLTTPDGGNHLVERALAELGGIDIVVNNVGVGNTDDVLQGALNNLIELPDSAWQHTFDLHFYSALRVTRAALPSLIERRGTVVNVSSAGARLVNAGPFDYNVSKAALNALTKVVAEQFGPQGVRAITISPGPVKTQVWTAPDGMIARLAAVQGVDHETFSEQLMQMVGSSTERITTPEEVARLIVFAASPSNINGAELPIDGGAVKSA